MKRVQPLTQVVYVALISRAILFSVAILLDYTVADYDRSSHLPNLSCSQATDELEVYTSEPQNNSVLCTIVTDLVSWDSVYFLRISECGYEYEQVHAFFPLLPFLSRSLHRTVTSVVDLGLPERCGLIICGLLVSNLSFLASALLLDLLGAALLQDPNTARTAALLFCFNPASVFNSMMYSESLFTALSLLGLWAWQRGAPGRLMSAWTAIPAWAAAAATRSNGVVLCGFPLFLGLHRAAPLLLSTTTPASSSSSPPGACTTGASSLLNGLMLLLMALIQAGLVILPLIAFQHFGAQQFCSGAHWASTPRSWCHHRLPYLYGFVQKNYWDVGFLRYFQIKQIPNFLLASPMIVLSGCGIQSYARFDYSRFLSLGFRETPAAVRMSADKVLSSGTQSPHPTTVTLPPPALVAGPSRATRANSQSFRHDDMSHMPARQAITQPDKNHSTVTTGFYSSQVLVYVYMWLAMLFVGVFVMHVQVVTRFLSTCPPVFWYAAHICHTDRYLGRVIWSFFLIYFLLGTFLFVNFYPWT